MALKAALIIACLCCMAVFSLMAAKGKRAPALVFKLLASACFVALGAASAKSLDHFSVSVLAGLFLGMFGDGLLGYRYLKPRRKLMFFVAGSMSFFLGHVLYIFALLGEYYAAVLPAVVFTALCMPFAWRYSRNCQVSAGRLMKFGVAYIAAVILMAGCALGAAIFSGGETAYILFFIGGVCFSISDVILVTDVFGAEKKPWRSPVLHVLYYAAQLLIALSLAF